MFDLDLLERACDQLATADPIDVPADELMAAATVIARVQSLAPLAQARVLAELHVTGDCVAATGDRPAAWLASQASLPRSTVEGWLRTGLLLRRFDKLDAAVANGELTFHHAHTVQHLSNPRVEDALAAAQDTIIHEARETTFKGFHDTVHGLIEDTERSQPRDPDTDRARTELHLTRTPDGIRLRGTFIGAAGETITTAIDAATQDVFRRVKADHQLTPDVELPSPANLRAIALEELLRRGQAIDLASSTPPRAEITLLANAADPDRVTDDTGVRVNHPSFDTYYCDPRFRPVIIDNLGVPLAMGHARDLATKDQKRAIALRDGPTCAWPGCDRPSSWTDAHHVKHRTGMRGRTDTDNLVALCRHHHLVTHRPGWQMRRAPDGWNYWITPSGDRFWQQRHQQLRTDPPPNGPPPVQPPPNGSACDAE